MLTAGEYAKLLRAAQEVCGFITAGEADGVKSELKKRIKRGDGELNYAFWCFVRCGMTPGEYAALPEREKLVVQAMIEVWMEMKERQTTGVV